MTEPIGGPKLKSLAIKARVAEWQTRWIQNPVPDKGVWVQVPPSVLSPNGDQEVTSLTIPQIGLMIVGILLALAWEMHKRARFIERFPPISDKEFMERCPPGTSRSVALRVRRIVADQLGVEYERIYPSSSFVDDLGC